MWAEPEELNLDAQAIHHLASVIKLQSEWVKQRSTSLYTDPFLLEEKINQKSKDELLGAFLKAWHPMVELEQLTMHSLADALLYWSVLEPIGQRWDQTVVQEVQTGTANRSELVEAKILRDEAFSAELDRYWQELKQKVAAKNSKIAYMDWVGAETYEETVHRAYLTSFLVTYGYATLEVNRLEEEISICPLEDPGAKLNRHAESVPITLNFESWQKWKQGEQP